MACVAALASVVPRAADPRAPSAPRASDGGGRPWLCTRLHRAALRGAAGPRAGARAEPLRGASARVGRAAPVDGARPPVERASCRLRPSAAGDTPSLHGGYAMLNAVTIT